MAKIHFRPYTTKQILLFPQKIDENIATCTVEGSYQIAIR